MSIAVRSDQTIWQDDDHPRKYWNKNLEPKQECFFCWEEIKTVALFWMGNGFDLWLHPDCFSQLTLRLSRDAWDLNCAMPQNLRQENRL